MTIYGTGFSATPTNNTVKFNGVTAVVSASASGSISTTVPASAATGRVTVTVGSATATNPQDFVVVIAGAPLITSFTPTQASASTTISVAGSNFATAPGATTVKVNGVTASSTIASTTSLSFVVPSAAGSGKISATNATGTGLSTQDLIVAPTGVVPSDIVATARLVPNGAGAPISLPPASKHGMVLFDGVVDGHYTLQFGQYGSSPVIAPTAYKVIKPDGGTLTTGTVGNYNNLRPTIHVPRLPAAGTYSVLLSPGFATFDSMISVVADPVLPIDGAATSVALQAQGQTSRLVINATAGQRLGLGLVNNLYTPAAASDTAIVAYKPDGTVLVGPQSCNLPASACDWEIVPVDSGPTTVIVSPSTNTAMSFTAYTSTEITGSIAVDGGANVVLSRFGQDGRYTFAVSAGDSIGIDLSGITTSPAGKTVRVRLLNPSGVAIRTISSAEPNGAFADLGTMAAGGTYTLEIDPDTAPTANVRVHVKQGPMLTTSASATGFTAAYIGESARMRFAATAGDNLSIGLTDLTYTGTSSSSTTLTVNGPTGTAIGSPATCSPTVGAGSCRFAVESISTTGTHSVVISGPGGVNPAGNVVLSTNLAASLSSGTPQALNASRAGQAAYATFAATAGDNIAVKLFGVASTPSGQIPTFVLKQPNGALVSMSHAGTNASSRWIEVASAPATGTYTLAIAPTYASTWQGTLLLDQGASLTLNSGTATLSTSAAGEPMRYRFAATAGQRLEIGISNLTYGAASANTTALTLVGPTGAVQSLASCTTATGCETWVTSLSGTGNYTLWVVPPAGMPLA